MFSKHQKHVTVASRVTEYKKEGMYLFEKNSMMCSYCQTRVDWARKSTIDNHIKAKNHQNNKKKAHEKEAEGKDSGLQKQTSLSDSFSKASKVKEDRETFIKSTVQAFVKANIPLHKLDNPHMKKWLRKYVPGSGDLPSADVLRKKYIPLLKKEYDEQLKEKVKGRKVVVMCDETTNRKGEAVFLTLLKILPSESDPHPSLFVASVKILSTVNADQCSKAVLQTLHEFDVEHANVVAVASDSAAYMNLAVRLLRGLLNNPQLVHVQCWAHKLDKVVKVFSDRLYRLNDCVSNTKRLFKNTRKRKHNYIKLLKDRYQFTNSKEIKQFPLPVMSRWGSWKKSVCYLSEYVEDVIAYAKTLPNSKDCPKAIKYFKKLKPEDISILQAEAMFVVEYCSPLSDFLVKVEGSHYPLAHTLYSEVNKLRKTFSVVKKASDVKAVLLTKTKVKVNAVPDNKISTLITRLKEVCTECDDILKNFMKEDTAHDFFESARILFDSSKLTSSLRSEVVTAAKEKVTLLDMIPSENFYVLHSVLSDIVKENLALVQARGKKQVEDIVERALFSLMSKHSAFVASCLQVLYVPVSNIHTERGFSAYEDIFSAKRTRLGHDKVETMMCLYYGDDIDESGNLNRGAHNIEENESENVCEIEGVYFNSDEDMEVDDLDS